MSNYHLTPLPDQFTDKISELSPYGLNTPGERMRYIRKTKRHTQSAIAKLTGITQTNITRYENNTTSIPHDLLIKFSKLTGANIQWIINGSGKPFNLGVPVVGRVGAGQEIRPFDDGDVDYIMPPFGAPSDAIGLRVVGDSMEPEISGGDVLIYRRDFDFIPEDCLNRKCIIKTVDGRVFVKVLKKSIEDFDRYNLLSTNAPPLLNQEVEWAAPVLGLVYAGSY